VKEKRMSKIGANNPPPLVSPKIAKPGTLSPTTEATEAMSRATCLDCGHLAADEALCVGCRTEHDTHRARIAALVRGQLEEDRHTFAQRLWGTPPYGSFARNPHAR